MSVAGRPIRFERPRCGPRSIAVFLLTLALPSLPALGQTPSGVWRPFGPSPQTNGYYSPVPGVQENVAGRSTAIAYSPNFDGQGHAAMYLGTHGGGVWRSTNFASTTPVWKPLTDNIGATPEQENGSIDVGSIAVSPINPRVIYAGTGESNFSADSRYGSGILKSTDGGNTWTLQSNSTFRRQSISSIFVDPTDATGNTVYCSMTYGPEYNTWGIYKTVNGGADWNNVSADILQQTNFAVVVVSSLEYTVDAQNHLTVFAGSGAIFGDPPGGVWRSTNGGANWTRLTNGLPSGNTVGRIALATYHSGANHSIYALVNSSFRATTGYVNLYKSTDNGDSWTLTTDPGDFGGTWYQLALCVAPPNAVYVAGLGWPFNAGGVRQSVDGGVTWNIIDKGTNGIVPHTDHHFMKEVNGGIYDANDGGLWRFNPLPGNLGGISTWDDLNTVGLQTISCNAIAIHPTNPNVALEGSQDNGSAVRSATGGNVWNTVVGGDGGMIRYYPGDPSIVYKVGPQGSYGVHDFFGRSDDGGLTFTGQTDVINTDLSFPGSEGQGPTAFPFYPFFAVDPSNGDRVVLGSTRVYETKNRAANWADISGELDPTQAVSALCYSASQESTIYAGFEDGKVFRTDTDGLAWLEADGGTAFPTAISWLVVDPADAMTAYLTLRVFDTPRVYQTIDGGASWTDISGDLPAVPVDTIIIDSRAGNRVLYVGTDVGVWQSANLGTNWSRVGTGLPGAQVVDLYLDIYNNRLVAATHGRGVWTMPFDIPGDVDGNGIVELADVVMALKIAGGLLTGTHDQVRRGDVLLNGSLNMADGFKLARSLYGL